MKYDAVIIGSGLGGLVCGSLLSQAGRSVLVLERQVQPGGCMQSYRRNGYTFDTGLHYIGGLQEGQKLHSIFSHLGLMRLPWHQLDGEAFDRITIAGQTFDFAQGYDRFVEKLSTHFPHQQAALRNYVEMLQQVDAVPLGSDEIFTRFGVNAYDYLKQTFTDDLLINVLSGSSLKMELCKESLPLYVFAHGQSSYIQSSWRLAGDGNMLVRQLTDNIQSNGGRVICKNEVEELVEEDGRIVMARCRNGEVYEGSIFISDIHPAATFDLVKESTHLKRLFRRRIGSLPNTFGMLTVSLVLKPGVLSYFNYNHFVYQKPDVWTFYKDNTQIGGLMVSVRKPEDDSLHARVVDLLTPLPLTAMEPWKDTRLGHRDAGYEAFKNKMADACVQLAETVLPSLASMVEQRYVSTPLTWRDYTLTPDGSAYGIQKDSRNLIMTMLSPRTPIPNLLLTGQNLMLHGVEGVTMTAMQTCGEILGQEYINKIINS